MSDSVWIPVVPLPFQGRRTDQCVCGKKFRGRDRRARYELHWRLEHEKDDPGQVQGEFTRAEADRIYAEVAAARKASS